MQTIEDYINEIRRSAEQRIKNAKKQYQQGCDDCEAGVYDKWYRYNTPQDGRAYDLGWQAQNKVTQNKTVHFIEVNNN